jgi:hypothetical protein
MVNFQKSFLVPINMNAEETQHLASTFGCKIGTMPFTYLGLPLGTTRPSVQDFSALSFAELKEDSVVSARCSLTRVD